MVCSMKTSKEFDEEIGDLPTMEELIECAKYSTEYEIIA